MKTDKQLLLENGWVMECQSPFEIRHQDGSFASENAAEIVLDSLRSEPELQLYCPKGFEYNPAVNELRAYLNGQNVSAAVAELDAAYHSGPQFDEHQIITHAKIVEGKPDCMLVDGCESFGIEDYAQGMLGNWLSTEVVCHDGEPYPEA